MKRPVTDFLKIENLMMNGFVFQTIVKCLELRLFDDFEGTIIGLNEYASKLGYKINCIDALFELLVAYGIFIKTNGGYTNSKLTSEYLVSTSKYYQGNLLKINGHFNDFIQSNFIEKLKGVEGARESSDDAWAMDESIKGSAAHARLGALQDTTDFISSLPNFSKMSSMCDIGGCHGEFTTALLDKNENLVGEITDFKEVCEAATKFIPLDKYDGRITLTPRDLRENPLPENNYDLIIASHVLYAFKDDLMNVLEMLHKALKKGGWLLTHHMNIDGGLPNEYSSVLELITRMSGYETHFFNVKELTKVMDSVGFNKIVTRNAGYGEMGIIVAGARIG